MTSLKHFLFDDYEHKLERERERQRKRKTEKEKERVRHKEREGERADNKNYWQLVNNSSKLFYDN